MKTSRHTLAIFAAMTFAAAVVAEETQPLPERSLGPNDFSYYRFFGKGETFGIAIADVTTNAERRAKFWKRVEEAKVPIIWQLTFKRAKGWRWALPKTSEEAIERIDAFFAPCEGVTPCPEKIFAVTPAEENITWDGQLAVQDAIAKHLREKYGVKTYQWLTEPLRPTLDIQADGWVFDAYSVTDPEMFYAHIESFILTGVPIVPCLWASGNFDGYHKAKTWDDLTRFTVARMDMCRSLNLPVLVFAVTGPGSVPQWFSKASTSGEQYYRETIRNYMAAVTNLPSASWKPQEKRWRVVVPRMGKVRAEIDLKSFYLTDSTTFDDIRNWRLEKGGLTLVGERGDLTWRLCVEGWVRRGVFVLRHSKGAKGTFCGKPLSADGVTRVEAETFCNRLAILTAEAPLVLEGLSFEGEGEGGEDDVTLAMDTSYGRTDYTAKVVLGDEGGLGGVNGRAATRRIVRHVPLPGHVNGRLMLEADVLADAKNYAGAVTMSVLSEKGEVLASVASDPAKDARQTLRLTDDPPDTPIFKQGFALPYGTQSVDIVFDLRVGCGIETPGRFGAQVLSATLKYRPLHP